MPISPFAPQSHRVEIWQVAMKATRKIAENLYQRVEESSKLLMQTWEEAKYDHRQHKKNASEHDWVVAPKDYSAALQKAMLEVLKSPSTLDVVWRETLMSLAQQFEHDLQEGSHGWVTAINRWDKTLTVLQEFPKSKMGPRKVSEKKALGREAFQKELTCVMRERRLMAKNLAWLKVVEQNHFVLPESMKEVEIHPKDWRLEVTEGLIRQLKILATSGAQPGNWAGSQKLLSKTLHQASETLWWIYHDHEGVLGDLDPRGEVAKRVKDAASHSEGFAPLASLLSPSTRTLFMKALNLTIEAAPDLPVFKQKTPGP